MDIFGNGPITGQDVTLRWQVVRENFSEASVELTLKVRRHAYVTRERYEADYAAQADWILTQHQNQILNLVRHILSEHPFAVTPVMTWLASLEGKPIGKASDIADDLGLFRKYFYGREEAAAQPVMKKILGVAFLPVRIALKQAKTDLLRHLDGFVIERPELAPLRDLVRQTKAASLFQKTDRRFG